MCACWSESLIITQALSQNCNSWSKAIKTWRNSHRAYVEFISVISICPSAHNPLFVITLIHEQHTHTHTHIPLMLLALKRQTHPHFQQYPIKHKAEGRIRSRLVLQNAPIRDHTGFKLPPFLLIHFQSLTGPIKFVSSIKKTNKGTLNPNFVQQQSLTILNIVC